VRTARNDVTTGDELSSPLTGRLDRPSLFCYRVEDRKVFDLAAVGGTDVLDSTSDLYRCGS